MLEKTEHMVILKDFYGPLLTEKQQTVLNLYYENDWSLSEIADHLNITRQAVYDLLKRVGNGLEDYEKRLHLVEKFVETRGQLEVVHSLLSESMDNKSIARAAGILREVIDSL